jgi:hypothetical protein
VKPWVNRIECEPAPDGAKERFKRWTTFLSPLLGLCNFNPIKPTAVAVGYFLPLLRSFQSGSGNVASQPAPVLETGRVLVM